MLYTSRSVRVKISQYTPYFEGSVLHQIQSPLSVTARMHYLWPPLQWIYSDS